jgi:uncharacterized protein YecE (DUF72 family)
MDFGRVQKIDEVDFTFPDDHPDTVKLFKSLKKKHTAPKVYVGCAKWGRPDWIGKIYPKGTKATDFLKHYTKYFNSIELNAMFYQTFPRTVTSKWASYADEDFRFCPKMSQFITHIKRLKGVEEQTDMFLSSLLGFGDKLGHTFIQFDDRFGTKNLDTLKTYLEYLPTDFKACVEFRQEDWFKESVITHDAFEMLREMRVGTVITDTSGRRDVLHMRLTTPVAFIRFVGNNLHPTDFKRIDDWVGRMKLWINSGIETIYFFIHNHEELNSPELCKYTIQKLNAATGLNIAEPQLLNDKMSLF